MTETDAARRAVEDQQDPDSVEDEAEEAPEPTEDDLVQAEHLDHGTGVRRVYRDLSFSIPTESLAVLLGGDGSGKSLLLLALIGRGHAIGGSLQVAGLDAFSQAKQLRKISTAARIGTFVDLEPRHSVRDARRDRAAFEGLSPTDSDRAFAQACELLELKLPEESLIEDLSRLQQTQLSLALALQQNSTLLVLDDADRSLNLTDQHRLYRSIDAVIDDTGSTVVVSSVEPASIPDHAAVIQLPAAGPADPAGTSEPDPGE